MLRTETPNLHFAAESGHGTDFGMEGVRQRVTGGLPQKRGARNAEAGSIKEHRQLSTLPDRNSGQKATHKSLCLHYDSQPS